MVRQTQDDIPGTVVAQRVKRAFDVVGAIGVLLVLSIPCLIIALIIRLTMGAPIIFRQERPGLHEEVFTMYKFRSMKSKVPGVELSESERITRFGRILRSTSLDELPQIFNVLQGTMSFVGPRPTELVHHQYFTDNERQRYRVLPGLTGWAQVNGRNNLSWDERLALDVWYVAHWSLWLDCKIVLKTVRVLLRREGHDQHAAREIRSIGEIRGTLPSSE